MKTIGVVVPTLFTRPDFLGQSLEAIAKAGDAHVILMGPNVKENSGPYESLFDQLIEEPKEGSLASKLSFALNSFPENIELITWIGDDDILEPASLDFLEKMFQENKELSLIYGSCSYIDSNGGAIGMNISGPWALKLSIFGPFLAPQPGSLFRKTAFVAANGLDPKLKLAFDFDLFRSLSKQGKAKYVQKPLASFRWHSDSLSVSQRKTSVKEASMVRLKHASPLLKPILRVTNPVVEIATFLAGAILSWRLKTRATP